MTRYILISLAGGILFGIMDGVLNTNPLAMNLNEVYKPILKTNINITAGILIDLAYGFILAGIFLVLYASLPGNSGVLKGLSFAAMAWFFRVVMYAASTWMMYTVPLPTILYHLIAGMLEMLVLGVLFGLTLRPLG